MKLKEKIRIGYAMTEWLDALDRAGLNLDKASDKDYYRYEDATIKLRRTLRSFGYSADIVERIARKLHQDVNAASILEPYQK